MAKRTFTREFKLEAVKPAAAHKSAVRPAAIVEVEVVTQGMAGVADTVVGAHVDHVLLLMLAISSPH
jgi:hypothetical protein